MEMEGNIESSRYSFVSGRAMFEMVMILLGFGSVLLER